MSKPPNSVSTYAARLQIPVLLKDTKARERLIVEFDFDDLATGVEVLSTIAAQLDDAHVIDLGNFSDISQLRLRLKELPHDIVFPARDRLLSDSRVYKVFLESNAPQSSAPAKPPTFVVVNTLKSSPSRRDTLLDAPGAATRGSSGSAVHAHASEQKSAENSERIRETSFSQVHEDATVIVDPQSPQPLHAPLTVDAMREHVVRLESTIAQKVRDMFQTDDAALVLRELPIPQEFLEEADALLESHVTEFKDMRATLLPGRQHWYHLLATQPSRRVWLQAMRDETAETRATALALQATLQRARAALAGSKEETTATLGKLDHAQVEAIKAQAAIRKRDALQERVQRSREEAEELRLLEETLHTQLRDKLQALHEASKKKIPSSDVDAPKSACDAARSTAQQTTAQQTPRRDDLSVADVPQSMPPQDLFFDEDPDRSVAGLNFLSPNLREQVSAVLRPPQAASPEISFGPSSGGTGSPMATDPQSDLRRLATQLSQYLDSSSPDPQSRLKLLEQVRRARDAVERNRQLSVPGTSQVRFRRGGSSHREPSQPSPYFFPTGSASGAVQSSHRYERGLPQGAGGVGEEQQRTASQLAEAAVPFFLR